MAEQKDKKPDDKVTGLPPTPENLTKTGAPVDERFVNRPAQKPAQKPEPQPKIPQPSNAQTLGPQGEEPAERGSKKKEEDDERSKKRR